MNTAIAVFVKTPGYSPVKTRLAASLGQEGAESFHLAAARAVTEVVQVLAQSGNIKGYYAVAEQSALHHRYWQSLPCIWQGEGGLGQKMARIYHSLLNQHDCVMLVGADIPQMKVSELRKGTAWLSHDEQARLVLGPSLDGGFWLFGGNCRVAEKLWTGVTYSVEDTASQFLNKVQTVGDIKLLSALRDVDEAGDLIELNSTLSELSDKLPAQQALLQFLQNNIGMIP